MPSPRDAAAAAAEKKRDDRQRCTDCDTEKRRQDEKVQEASEESFPASDPPGYSGGHS